MLAFVLVYLSSRPSPLSFFYSRDLHLDPFFSRSKGSRAFVRCIRKSLFRILREIATDRKIQRTHSTIINICVQLYTSVCPPSSLPRKPLVARATAFYTHPRFLFVYHFKISPAFRSDSDPIVHQIYLNRARASQRGPATKTRFFLPRSYLIRFVNFSLSFFTTTHDSRPRRTHVCPRVYAARTACLRRRDGGSSLNAAISLTASSITQHPPNNNIAFPPVRCPNKRHRVAIIFMPGETRYNIYIYTHPPTHTHKGVPKK